MIATAPQPLQSSQADAPTYVELIKAILSETLNDQGLWADGDELDV
ncbi:MAG: hypothetical protein ACFB0C_03740 [Leptolyngbyaceae cyanobacterium]